MELDLDYEEMYILQQSCHHEFSWCLDNGENKSTSIKKGKAHKQI